MHLQGTEGEIIFVLLKGFMKDAYGIKGLNVEYSKTRFACPEFSRQQNNSVLGNLRFYRCKTTVLFTSVKTKYTHNLFL